jgi:acyl carrier protein
MEKISIENICIELLLFVQSSILDSSVKISPETHFSEIGIDSMSIIELVLFIERKFNVAISEKDLSPENLKSIQTLAECTFKYL